MSAVAFVATADGLILNPQTLQGNAVIGCLEVSLMGSVESLVAV